MMKKRNLEVLRHQQRQPYNAQSHALLLALSPLGQRVLFVEAVNEGVEVRRVVEQTGQVDLEAFDKRARQVLFDGADPVGIQVAHVIPETLAGEVTSRNRQEPAQNGPLVPCSHTCLARGSQASVQGGQRYVAPDACALVALAGMPIDCRNQIEPLSQVIQRCRSAEIGDENFPREGRFGRGPHVRGDVLGLAEVLLPNDPGLSVDTLAFAGIPIGMAADDFLVQADGHG